MLDLEIGLTISPLQAHLITSIEVRRHYKLELDLARVDVCFVNQAAFQTKDMPLADADALRLKISQQVGAFRASNPVSDELLVAATKGKQSALIMPIAADESQGQLAKRYDR